MIKIVNWDGVPQLRVDSADTTLVKFGNGKIGVPLGLNKDGVPMALILHTSGMYAEYEYIRYEDMEKL